MQKKLIALAVAGLASTAAFAQTNVTIYGLIDYGYAYRFDGKNAVPNSDTINSSSQLNGGQQSGNRLGFKGTEDLGNGLKAVFLLEQGFQSDTGASASSNSFYNRQAYVGLSGNFGTAVGGRLYTPHYTFVSGLDPFAAGTVGRYNNVYSVSAFSVPGTAFGNLTDPVRVDNAVAYISPSFGGFTVTGAYSNNASGNEANGAALTDSRQNSENNTVYAILGQYTGGALTVGANYHYIAAGTGLRYSALAIDNVQNFTLGGSYDFKVAKVMALYSWNEIDNSLANFPNTTLNNYMLGATVPFGKFAAKGSYMYSDGNQGIGDAQQVALGLDYNLSKRTNLYSAYSWIDNNTVRMNGVGDASTSGVAAASNNTLPGAFQQGFQFGVRHMF